MHVRVHYPAGTLIGCANLIRSDLWSLLRILALATLVLPCTSTPGTLPVQPFQPTANKKPPDLSI